MLGISSLRCVTLAERVWGVFMSIGPWMAADCVRLGIVLQTEGSGLAAAQMYYTDLLKTTPKPVRSHTGSSRDKPNAIREIIKFAARVGAEVYSFAEVDELMEWSYGAICFG